MKILFSKIIFLVLLLSGCNGNLYSEIASSDPDDVFLINAKAAINALDYVTAIQILTVQVSAGAQAKSTFKETLASAYAGKCGLNFAGFVNGLANATTGSAFKLIMTPFVGIPVDPPSCLLALNKMQSIAATAGRTANQNAFVAVVGMSLMGSQIRTSADQSPVNGDGTVDKVLCSISDADINNIVLGFGFMSQNFSFLSTQLVGNSSHTALNAIISQCTAVAGANCSIIDPTAITVGIRDTMRDFINTQEYGIGIYVTGGNAALIPGSCP